MKGPVNVLILIALFGVESQENSAPYEVHWLTTKVDSMEAPDKMVIHCYRGKAKTMKMLWHTAVILIFTEDKAFNLHVGNSAEEIYDHQVSWQHFNRPDKRRAIVVDPFKVTCIYVETIEHYSVQVIITVDIWRVVLMLVGILIVFSARTLSRHPAFFYLLASTFGLLVIILVILYYLSRQSILRTGSHVTLLFGGLTTLVYFFQQLDVGMTNKYFSLAAGFISFLVAYRIGPPQCPRTRNIMMWMLQGLGAAVIILSTWHEEAAVAVFLTSLGIAYLFQFLTRRRRINGTQGTNKQVDKGCQNGKEQV